MTTGALRGRWLIWEPGEENRGIIPQRTLCTGKAFKISRNWTINAELRDCWSVSRAQRLVQLQAERSLRLAGAAAALRQNIGAPLTPAEQAKLEASLRPARQALTNTAGVAAWLAGWALPVEKAIEEVLMPEAASSWISAGCSARRRLLCAGRIKKAANGGDAIGRNTYAPGVFLDCCIVRGQVDAVNLIAGYVAVEPLNLRAHSLENADRFLRDFPQLGFGKIPGSRDFAFDNKLWHEQMLACGWGRFNTAWLLSPAAKIALVIQGNEVVMDIRSLQKPLKEQYRNDPNASQITIRAKGGQTTDVPVSCSVDIGRAIYQAEAHKGVGGAGAGACSGDSCWGPGGLRADHLSDGSCCNGHTQPNASRSRWRETWISAVLLAYRKTCLSDSRAFVFISILLRLRRHRNNCAHCERRQNNIVW